MVIVPLIAGARAIAVMKLVWANPRPLDCNEVGIAQLLANMCAALMHQAAREGNDVLHRRLTVDEVTGVANRAYFFEKLRTRLQANDHAGVGLIRVEGLGQGMDGEASGILRSIEAECREGDFVARVAVNEFAIIFSMAMRRSVVTSQLLRISHAVTRSGVGQVRSGSALSPDDGLTAADLFYAATATLTRSAA